MNAESLNQIVQAIHRTNYAVYSAEMDTAHGYRLKLLKALSDVIKRNHHHFDTAQFLALCNEECNFLYKESDIQGE